ncbi:MAG: hypothetical protein RRA35_02000, partial [Desulfomonilia bacterium]|nr:hypothetical protein [Desulfomonilia bacterium]
MKRLSTLIIITILILGFFGYANATTITFEDVTSSSSTNVQIPEYHYDDFYFGGNYAWVLHNKIYTNNTWNNDYTSPEGDYALFNGWGVLNFEIIFYEPVNFLGAFFSSFAQNNSIRSDERTALSITVFGYSNNSLVDTPLLFTLSTTQYDYLQTNLFGIDRLLIQATSNVST